jgi:integrase
MLSDYVSKKKVRSAKTAKTYQGALRVWAASRGSSDADRVVQEIKDKQLDAYRVLQDFVVHLQKEGRAPKTITTYIGALKGFLIDSDIEISNEKMRQKVVVPQAYEISSDRAPTKEEVRNILLRSSLPTKTVITMLASSGMRIGELTQLKVSNLQFGEKNMPSKILLKPSATKTRKRRMTFITAEATEFLREHLGEKISNPLTILFPEGTDALYGRIMRAIGRTGLKEKSDDESARYELHPHCFRKYFFSNCLAAGIDRGLVEGFMGHAFALDSAYLRMTDEELAGEYSKSVDRLTFLSAITNNHIRTRLEEADAKIAGLERQVSELTATIYGILGHPSDATEDEKRVIINEMKERALERLAKSKAKPSKQAKIGQPKAN